MCSCLRRIQKFFQEGAPKFDIFKRSFFPAELFWSIFTMKKAPGGSGCVLPRKNFDNLLTLVAILVLFEQFSGKFCLIFSP